MLHFCHKHLPSHAALSLLQFPTADADPVLLTLFFFCASPFLLLSVAWFYIFFPRGQVLSWLLQDLLCLEVYIPDVSVERDDLHVHLLFCHRGSQYGIEPTLHSKSGLLWAVVEFCCWVRIKSNGYLVFSFEHTSQLIIFLESLC